MSIVTTDVETPAGTLRVAVHHRPDGSEAVVACAFTDHWERLTAPVRRRFADEEWVAGPSQAGAALAAWVDGDLAALDGLAVDADGSPFQRRVWEQLREIPVGETRSYGDVARALGQPTATRAVGAANGRNPVWVLVPCHRVIRSDAGLGGYGGGLDRKRWLLAHERQAVAESA